MSVFPVRYLQKNMINEHFLIETYGNKRIIVYASDILSDAGPNKLILIASRKENEYE